MNAKPIFNFNVGTPETVARVDTWHDARLAEIARAEQHIYMKKRTQLFFVLTIVILVSATLVFATKLPIFLGNPRSDMYAINNFGKVGLSEQDASPVDNIQMNFLEQNLDVLIQTSDTIIVGQVTKKESRWNNKHTLIYTYFYIDVEDVLNGISEGKIIVKRLGGKVDNIAQAVIGEAPIQVGDHKLLFLVDSDEPGIKEILFAYHAKDSDKTDYSEMIQSAGLNGQNVSGIKSIISKIRQISGNQEVNAK